MEQTPVPGHEMLAPPDADVAQRYLDEAASVAERRDRTVDRRGMAWMQIVGAAATAAYLVVLGMVMRADEGAETQLVVFSFLLWVQLSSGIAQRRGMQWRVTRSRWPLLAGCVLVGVTALVLFGFAVWYPGLPLAVLAAPAAIILVGMGGYGVLQLVRARHDPRVVHEVPVRLPRAVRIGTVLIGVAFGAMMMLATAPDGVLLSTLILVLVLALAVWMFAFASEIGLASIGELWRWPHLSAFAVCVGGLSVLLLLPASPPWLGVVGGIAAVALFALVSLLPGRDGRG